MEQCQLCGRPGPRLTKHHLVPRARHSNKRVRRLFDREQRQETIVLCRPCHDNLHTVLTEKQLADEYNTLERIAAHPDVRKFTRWVSDKPPETSVPVRRKPRDDAWDRRGRRR